MKPEGRVPASFARGVLPIQKALAFHSLSEMIRSVASSGGKNTQKSLASTTCAIIPYAFTLIESKLIVEIIEVKRNSILWFFKKKIKKLKRVSHFPFNLNRSTHNKGFFLYNLSFFWCDSW